MVARRPGRNAGCWRLFIFCTPIDEQNTAVFTLGFTKSVAWSAGGVRLFKWFFARQLDYEVWLATQSWRASLTKAPTSKQTEPL